MLLLCLVGSSTCVAVVSDESIPLPRTNTNACTRAATSTAVAGQGLKYEYFCVSVLQRCFSWKIARATMTQHSTIINIPIYLYLVDTNCCKLTLPMHPSMSFYRTEYERMWKRGRCLGHYRESLPSFFKEFTTRSDVESKCNKYPSCIGYDYEGYAYKNSLYFRSEASRKAHQSNLGGWTDWGRDDYSYCESDCRIAEVSTMYSSFDCYKKRPTIATTPPSYGSSTYILHFFQIHLNIDFRSLFVFLSQGGDDGYNGTTNMTMTMTVVTPYNITLSVIGLVSIICALCLWAFASMQSPSQTQPGEYNVKPHCTKFNCVCCPPYWLLFVVLFFEIFYDNVS